MTVCKGCKYIGVCEDKTRKRSCEGYAAGKPNMIKVNTRFERVKINKLKGKVYKI